MSSVNDATPSVSPAPASPDQSVPIPGDALIIVPVRNIVLFPGVVHPGHDRTAEIHRGGTAGRARAAADRRRASARCEAE